MSEIVVSTFRLNESHFVRLANGHTGTDPRYLVMYADGEPAEVVDVHDMIDRCVDYQYQVHSVRLLTTAGEAPTVTVTHVTDTEWTVTVGLGASVDYVRYSDTSRDAIADRRSLVVDAPEEAPTDDDRFACQL